MGYYNHTAPAGQVFDQDGYFRTGDIGYYDELEQIYVVDRVKELIKYKAFQVCYISQSLKMKYCLTDT